MSEPQEDRLKEAAVPENEAPAQVNNRSHSVSPQRSVSWYYSSLYPGYKKRKKEFHELFPGRAAERFVVDYSCAFHKDILHQGRLYLSTQTLCFYSYILGWENKLEVPFELFDSISKEKTALFIPNAIKIVTKEGKQFFFASFVDRDSSFQMVQRLWQAVESENPIPDKDLDSIIACEYGEEEKMSDENGASTKEIETKEKSETFESTETVIDADDTRLRNWLKEGDASSTVSLCDRKISQSASSLFELLYSNSDFYFNFQRERGTTELEIGEWEESGPKKLREVRYNMAMSIPVGPRHCQVRETQELREVSSQGEVFFVETKAKSSGVPYADAFTVVTNSCIYDLKDGSSRLIARAEIKFEKDLWGFLKEKIEVNAINGLKSHYSELVKALDSFDCKNPLINTLSGLQQQHLGGGREPLQQELQPQGERWESLWEQHPFILVCLAVSIILSLLSVATLCRMQGHLPPQEETLFPELSLEESLRYEQASLKMKTMLVEAVSKLEEARAVLDKMARFLDEFEAKSK